jgi:dihydrofolate reductase
MKLLNRIELVLIVAVAENGVIGRDNQLPWRLKSDMRHFRARTMGKPVVMGRRTFQSLGRQLTGRTVIVVTRDREFAAPGVVAASSLAAALAAARGDALRRAADAVMVAGGGEIYAAAMPLADCIEMTLVHARPEGDTLFPTIDPEVWREVERIEHPAGPHDSADFAFVRFKRHNMRQSERTTTHAAPAITPNSGAETAGVC